MQPSLLVFWSALLAAAGLPGAQARPGALSAQLERALAERFAPVLAFHGAEEFFPCSPFFVLDLPTRGADVGDGLRPRSADAAARRDVAALGRVAARGDAAARGDVAAPDDAAALDDPSALGDVASRTERYRSLSRARRVELARVFYQAYPFVDGGGPRVVVEYWLYYVQNAYRSRSGVFPVRVDTSHPNDMEHIFLILRPVDGAEGAADLPDRAGAYAIQSVLASAHHGNLPTNVYSFPAGHESRRPLRFIVELGSHAVAADIDGDGVFDEGADSDGGKFVWGIRDSGAPWAAYDSSYMDPRGGDNAIVLSPLRGKAAGSPSGSGGEPGAGQGAGPAAEGSTRPSAGTYRLVAAEALDATFQELGLSDAQVAHAFEVSVGWPKRLFGRSDGQPDKLLLPSRHEDFGDPRRLKSGYADLERGLDIGYTNILYGVTLFAGGRYTWINTSRVVPDVVVEGQALVTAEGNDYYELALLGSYPIDTMSRVFAGASLITDDIRFDKRQYGLLGGIEFRLAAFRFRTAYRTTGQVSRAKVDFRLYYLFF